MQKQKVKLTFITVNYNGLEDTKALLQSIRDAKLSIDYAVVVVDNGSKVDEWVLLKSSFPEILGLRSEANLGFAGGNNLGLDFVETDYYYFINNDTLLPEGADKQIQDMLAFMASDTSIGGISPKIKYVEESNMLQYAGCTPLSAVTLRNQQIGYQEEDRGQYQGIIEVPYLHGAAMLISKVALQETGPMPEFYFLYYEEVDWCYSIRQKFSLYYYPKAEILHKESASTGMDSPFKTYYLVRNRLFFAYRHRAGITCFMAVLYLSLVNIVKGIALFLKGLREHSKATFRGMNDGLKWILKQKTN